jgi:hypothetical protein
MVKDLLEFGCGGWALSSREICLPDFNCLKLAGTLSFSCRPSDLWQSLSSNLPGFEVEHS